MSDPKPETSQPQAGDESFINPHPYPEEYDHTVLSEVLVDQIEHCRLLERNFISLDAFKSELGLELVNELWNDSYDADQDQEPKNRLKLRWKDDIEEELAQTVSYKSEWLERLERFQVIDVQEDEWELYEYWLEGEFQRIQEEEQRLQEQQEPEAPADQEHSHQDNERRQSRRRLPRLCNLVTGAFCCPRQGRSRSGSA